MLSFPHHHYHAARLAGLAEINAMHALRSIAEGVSSIFIPLFLISQGYSLTSVFGYLFMLSLFWLVSQLAGTWLITRLGIRGAIVLSIVASIVQYILLFMLATYHVPLILIAFFGGLAVTLFWLPFRIAFIELLAHHSTGKSVGASNALLILAGGITPAIGGAVATLFGTSTLYGAAIVLFLLAIVPLFFLRHLTVPKPKPVPVRKVLPDLVASGAFCVDDAAEFNVWPLFIFLFLPSYVEVGALASVTLLSAILISLYAGAREERKGVHRYMKTGSWLTGVANFLRVLVSAVPQVFGVNLISGSGKSLVLTPFITRYCINGEQNGITYLNMMLIAGGIGWTAYLGLLTLLTLILGAKLVALVGLLVAAPLVLLVPRMR